MDTVERCLERTKATGDSQEWRSVKVILAGLISVFRSETRIPCVVRRLTDQHSGQPGIVGHPTKSGTAYLLIDCRM
jgi:hypothetical protein